MPDIEAAAQLIYSAVDVINDQLPSDDRLDKTPDTVLSADAGGLDSLSLINLVVEVEAQVQSEWGKALTLITEGAFAQQPSPFSTLGSLADYLLKLANEADA